LSNACGNADEAAEQLLGQLQLYIENNTWVPEIPNLFLVLNISQE
jgi:hypothetical protein